MGTVDPNEVRAAWLRARGHFTSAGHVPAEAAPELEPRAMKGYSYYLFDPAHLTGRRSVDADGRGGLLLVGDSLGLAQPLTAEGILPAVVSARVCAEAILAGEPARYAARLAAHPLMEEYRASTGCARRPAALRSAGQREPTATATPTADRVALARFGKQPSRPGSPGCSRARGCRRRPLSISR